MSRRVLGLVALGAIIGLAGIGCGSSASSTASKTPGSSTSGAGGSAGGATAAPGWSMAESFTVDDHQYQPPASLVGGVNLLALRNGGSELHEFRFLLLHGGATADDVKAAIRSRDRARLAALTDSYGGAAVAPGATAMFGVQLAPGSYVVFSTETGATGPDVAAGLFAAFTVGPGSSRVEIPPSAAAVTISDKGYDLPSGLGRGNVSVVNSASSPQEFRLFHVDASKSLADVRGLFAGQSNGPLPAWIQDTFGGVLDMSPGVKAWTSLSLTPGRYVATSFSLDPKTQVPEAVEGAMLTDFTVK